MKKNKTRFDEINKANEETAAHRKKWLKKPVLDKRYIRGTIQAKIEESIHSRSTGHKTTDPAIRAAVLAKTGGTCYLCHRIYDPTGLKAEYAPDVYFSVLQIDHVVPFDKFGPNHIGNYMPACSQCNNLKSNLNLSEARARIAKKRRR